MAQIQRQNNLFAAEDFRTIYRTFSEINFTSYDFDTIKAAMVEYLQRNFPEDFNDFIESSEFIAIVELLAYMGQTIAFRQDLNTRENFLDTAERSESIRRLARMLNYSPKRNIPAAGLTKIVSISTDEEIIDSAGNSLSNKVITWNDPNNTEFLEQLTLVLNAVFSSTNPYGTPIKKGTVSTIPVEQYQLDVVKNLAVIYSLSGNVNGENVPFEIVNSTFDDGLFFKEQEPNPSNNLSMFYLNDGLGNSSVNTGFFMYIKQGTLTFEDFTLNTPLPNREIFIDQENINEFDVWAQTVDDTGTVLDSWTKVPSVSGNNVVYNSLLKNKRKIFTVDSELNDKVTLQFADGAFGDIPIGTMRVWHRNSLNRTVSIRPEDLGLQTIQIPYVGKNNTTHILNVTVGLSGTLGASVSAESNTEIKTNAPQTFYTQDRMVNGEDYNTYPLYKNNDIIKIKAVNRTHAGHSRFIDINDPTGTVANLNVFSEDGFIYKDEENIQKTIELTASLTSSTIIQRHIQPQISEDEVTNFYYDSYRKAVHTADGSSAWRFGVGEVMKWVALPDALESNKGYFVSEGSASIATNFLNVGNANNGKNTYVAEQALLEFQDSIRSKTKFATLSNLSADGNPAGLTTGPVELNVPIPSGYILTRVYPKFRKIFNTTEQTAIFTQLDLKNTFGIGYDYALSAYYVINPNNLSVATDFSLVDAKDNTNANKDASWLIKVDYQEATTLTNATYVITTRGLRYIFESEEEVRFYFDQAFKTVDVKTGQAKKDEITLLKVNTDKRSQIERINIVNPGNGYASSPIVSFEQSGEIDPATAEAQLSWNTVNGGTGGQGYTPIDSSVTFLDSATVDSNNNPTEIVINNTGVLDTSTGGRSIRLRANISSGATGSPVIANDRINAIALLNGGSGYTAPPAVTIPAPVGGGTQATAVATISSSLSGVDILDAGGGYNDVATISFASPSFSGTTWIVNHNLGQKHVNYEIVNTSNNVVDGSYQQPVVTFVNTNTLHVTWQSTTTGYIDVIKSKFVSAFQNISNEWIVDHNLGQSYPNIEVIYNDGVNDTSAQGTFDYPLIEYTSNNQVKIKFPTGTESNIVKKGYVVATHNATNTGTVGSGFNFVKTAPAVTWSVTHGLGKRYVNVDIAVLGSSIDTTHVATSDGSKYYNIRGHYDQPTINYVDENNLTITWTASTAGKATISSGNDIGTPATGTVHMEVGDSAGFGGLKSGTTWTITHNQNQRFCNFEIVDSSHNVIDGIYAQPVVTMIDVNTASVVWPTATTGYVDLIKSNFASGLQSSANVWTVTHNLGQQYPNIDVFDSNGKALQGGYDHPLIEYTSTTQCKIIFPTGITRSGYVAATHSKNNGATGEAFSADQSSSTTWSINHNLGKQHVNFDIAVLGSSFAQADFTYSIDSAKYYNIRGHYDMPVINYVDSNNLTVTWNVATAGKITVSSGLPDGSPTGCPEYTITNGGTGFDSGTVGDTITVALPGTGTQATATIATVSGGAVTAITMVNRGDYTALTGAPTNRASMSDSTLNTSAVTPTSGTVAGLVIDFLFRVKSVTLTAVGAGYQSLPIIIFSEPLSSCGTKRKALGQATRLGNVVSIDMTNTGSGYTDAELPTLNSGLTILGGGGVDAQGEVQLLSSSITSVTILTAGSGYSPGTPPQVTFTTAPLGGTTAVGTAAVNAAGNVTGITLSNTGSGYVKAPVATFDNTGSGGSNAAANVNVNEFGQVSGLTITNAGAGYTSAPTITISGNTGSNATVTASVEGGSVTTFLVTNAGTNYTAPPTCTIAGSGSIDSLNIIDPGWGYIGRPIITYGTPTGGTGATGIVLDGFVSFVKVTDPGNGYTPDSTVSFSIPTSSSPITATGTPVIKTNQSLENDIKFNLSKLLTYTDGYQDPRKALITFHDSDGDGIPDDPLSFDKFVDVSRYMFEETFTDFDGYTYYKLSRNVIQADTTADENLIMNNAALYAGKYIYRTDTKIFKKIGLASPYGPTALTDATDGALKLAAFIGRSGYNTPKVNSTTSVITPSVEEKVFFQWKHYAPQDQRVDPSVTNLIDIFILTKTYYDKVLAWKANNKLLTEFPAPPTNTELAIGFNNLNNYKSISDQLIYRPVKFKLLFGQSANQELQANFKVIKTIGSDVSDNELRSKVVEAINIFFLLNNWDLGESFYYTELAAFIHQSMPTLISSVALVPVNSESNFGNLFQVKAEVDELFLPVAKVADVEVVKGFTEQNLKIK